MAPMAKTSSTPALVVLARAGVEHTVHAFDASDDGGLGYGRAAAGALGVDEARVFKTLLAVADGLPVVAVVPVAGELSLKALAAAVGAKRAEMLAVADAERLTGYVVGGISPLGQRKRLETVVDSSWREHDTVYVSAGRRGLDVELAPGELVALLGARTADLSTH